MHFSKMHFSKMHFSTKVSLQTRYAAAEDRERALGRQLKGAYEKLAQLQKDREETDKVEISRTACSMCTFLNTFGGHVLGCIDADFCVNICVLEYF